MSESEGNRDSELSLEEKERIDLLCDVFAQQWICGGRPRIEEFVQQLPDIEPGILIRELIAVELEQRRGVNEEPAKEEYVARFPGHSKAVDEAFDLVAQRRPDETRTIEQAATGTTSPRQIGPYKLLQQIGEGGMGTVWMADQERPVRRRVALKVIKAGMDSKQVIARFEAERQALAMMDHQNIAKVLDAGMTEDGRPYFAMELVQGIPITEYCDQNKLSLNDRLELFVPVCNAVQHAHQKGIIHRDLKPTNVLVTLYDGKPVPKVIDFGLAKALQHQSRLTDKTLFTEFGQVVGTLQYMSPEQAEMNALNVDTRTDVYSLGVMLYEVLTGSTPIEKEKLRENVLLQIIQQIKEKEPPRPSARISESGDAITGISEQRKMAPAKLQQILRGELDWVVMKALEKDRTRRYETSSGLAQDIRRYLNDEAVEARPQSTTYRLRKLLRKNRKMAVTSITIAMLLMLLTFFGGFGVKTWSSLQRQRLLTRKAETATKAAESAEAAAMTRAERLDVALIEARQAKEMANQDAVVALVAKEAAERNAADSKQARAVAEVAKMKADKAAAKSKELARKLRSVVDSINVALKHIGTGSVPKSFVKLISDELLANAYLSQGEFKNAETLLLQLHRVLVEDLTYEKALPEVERLQFTFNNYENLIEMYTEWGRLDEVQAWEEKLRTWKNNLELSQPKFENKNKE